MKRITLPLVVLLVLIGACNYRAKSREASPIADKKTNAQVGALDYVAGTPQAGEAAPKKLVPQQKIIRTAAVEIESRNLEEDLARIEGKVKEIGGYVASSTQDRRTETSRSGRIECKIPAERLDEFLGFLQKEFTVEAFSTNSQDITEEYTDLDARLKNSQLEEKRLIELLETKTGKIEEVLMVERELSRVRENIEVLEGRMRFYDNRVALSTVTIDLRQERGVAGVKSSWFRRLARDFRDTIRESVELLGNSLRALVLFVAVALPWLVAGGTVLYIIVKLARRRKKKAKTD